MFHPPIASSEVLPIARSTDAVSTPPKKCGAPYLRIDGVSDITFDYFAMHNRCWELLDDVRKELDQRMGDTFTSRFIPQPDKLPFVVCYVFATAAGRLDIDCEMAPLPELMHIAAERVVDFLKRERGNAVGKQIYTEKALRDSISENGEDDNAGEWVLDDGDSEVEAVTTNLQRAMQLAALMNLITSGEADRTVRELIFG